MYRLSGFQVRTANIFDHCIFAGRHVEIGRDTFVNRGCYFEGVAPIVIGEECQIAIQAILVTSTHVIGPDGRISRTPEARPVRVGDRCWIGSRAVVLPGVTIGSDVVIAAGAVVASDCEDGWLYGGVPARKIHCLKDMKGASLR
jgi:maltose O-acetyltransferase